VAIETALTLRLLFHLPLRQTEGFLRTIFWMLDLDLSAPDHTTLSRRRQHLDPTLRGAPTAGPPHLVVDSTGLSIAGEGEWAAVKHGGRGIRGWKKLHLGVDGAGVIVAHALTGGHVDDATTAIDLVAAVERSRSHDQGCGRGRTAAVEEGVWVLPTGPGRERLLPVQVDHWGQPPGPRSRRAGE